VLLVWFWLCVKMGLFFNYQRIVISKGKNYVAELNFTCNALGYLEYVRTVSRQAREC